MPPPGPPDSLLPPLDKDAVQGSHAVSASGTAPYVVTFDRIVGSCAAIAAPNGPNAQVVVSSVVPSGSTVSVYVVNRATGAFNEASVSLAVYC